MSPRLCNARMMTENQKKKSDDETLRTLFHLPLFVCRDHQQTTDIQTGSISMLCLLMLWTAAVETLDMIRTETDAHLHERIIWSHRTAQRDGTEPHVIGGGEAMTHGTKAADEGTILLCMTRPRSRGGQRPSTEAFASFLCGRHTKRRQER